MPLGNQPEKNSDEYSFSKLLKLGKCTLARTLASPRTTPAMWRAVAATLQRSAVTSWHTPGRTRAVLLCEVVGCACTATERSKLTVHTRTHTGERTYSCEVEGCG